MDKTVFIPATTEHMGMAGIKINLEWKCPVCRKPRGQIIKTKSYDGSRILDCDGWENECGHIDKYTNCIKEAQSNGLNKVSDNEGTTKS